MLRIASLVTLALIAALGCDQSANTDEASASDDESKKGSKKKTSGSKKKAATGGVDIESGDAQALCEQLVPDDIYDLGVSDRWSDQRKLRHKKLYRDKRLSCWLEGFDPARRVGKPATFFKFEVECGKSDPQAMCKDKLADAKLRPGDVFSEEVDGALCHTLSTDASNNFVVMDNGCFIIIYDAQPDIMGIDAAERDERRKSTKLAVAKALVAKVSP